MIARSGHPEIRPFHPVRLTAALAHGVALLAAAAPCLADPPITLRASTTAPTTAPASIPLPTLGSAPEIEQQAITRQLADTAWPRRAIAAIRLERYRCDESRYRLIHLLGDPAWQVRAFAVRTLARRQETADPSWFAAETEPRVLRAALRHRYPVDHARLQRGVRALARSNKLDDKLLAADLGVASGDDELKTVATEAVKQVILRASRIETGVVSQRLAILTGQNRLHTQYDWQNWLLKAGRRFEPQPVFSIGPGSHPPTPSMFAQLESESFCGLDAYMTDLRKRPVDLVICLDCTASMSRQIAAAQGGIDDMMRFVGDVVSSLRVGLVAYRDRRDDFETKAFDFNADIQQVRQHLWQLSADGGGDTPEAVYPAMKIAMTQLGWRGDSAKILIVVGDAPPHIGFGGQCIDIAQRGREQVQLATHMIEAAGKPVEHFQAIAKAGGGRCVKLEDDESLMAEITGLTLGDRYQDEFREFYRVYLELCR